MDIEKAEHLNIFAVAVIFLLVLTYIGNQFLKDVMISFSFGLIITSIVLIFLLFEQIIGFAIFGFFLILIVISIIVNNVVAGLFISSLILGIFVLLTVLTR